MKLLIGGSPCTHWSIAQTKNRETEASGIGWELFLNYRIARDKYKPDYFLYENNKSMSPAIRTQITAELGVEPVLINSALLSAQNRQRLYWVGRRNPDGTYSQAPVEQPEDRGILLRDILETGVAWSEKSYCITATEAKGSNPQQTLTKHHRTMVAEPIDACCVAQRGRYIGEGGKVAQHFEARTDGKTNTLTTVEKDNLVAEPIRIGTIENDAKNPDHDSQQYRVYSLDGKSVTLCGNGGGVGAKTGLYAVPCCMRYERSPEAKRLRKQYEAHEISHGYHEFSELHPRTDGKSNTLSTVLKDNPICEPVIEMDESGHYAISAADGKKYPVYEVRNGLITITDKQYPIKLADGFYIIRKLTVTECMRLQTVPEEYVFPVSNSQAYKMLGNGWTVDVIAHIMSHFEGLTTEPVEVLSMYDGMSCGHIALDKLGAEITAYYATEIDKYAIQTTQHNFPEAIQLGDAFQVRNDDWRVEE